MKRYMLSVEVKLAEVPEPSEILPMPENPMEALSGMATKLMAGPGIAYPFVQPGGLDFRKQVCIAVGTFASLAKVLERYEELTTEMELEKV